MSSNLSKVTHLEVMELELRQGICLQSPWSQPSCLSAGTTKVSILTLQGEKLSCEAMKRGLSSLNKWISGKVRALPPWLFLGSIFLPTNLYKDVPCLVIILPFLMVPKTMGLELRRNKNPLQKQSCPCWLKFQFPKAQDS